ncbi:MAG: phosphopantetheine-binding protein [Thermoanaerobaculia bacterium]|nr:phosphopantetheine-binding protein [Thermoanaerobaculia bacterium]
MSEKISNTADTEELENRIKRLVVERLKLDIEPSEIESSEPLFGNGLGLDSIDALELVLGVEQEFGVEIEDEEVGAQALTSVETLVEFVASKQAERAASA